MASLPVRDIAGVIPDPQVAGEILLLPVADIEIGERLREIDEVWAQALGAVMVREGQQTAIEVCRLPGRSGWTLVAGAHRLTGARHVGMEWIEARVVSSSADHRRLREASENLWRKGLDPLARAAHVAELTRLHKLRAGIDVARDGRAVSAAVRWQKAVSDEADDATATIASAYGWSEQVGAEIGISARTVRDDLMLYRRIPAGLIASLRAVRSPILLNAAQLKALAKLEEAEQHRVVELLIADTPEQPCRTVTDALGRLRPSKPVPDAETKRLSAFIGAFSRMSQGEKKAALAELIAIAPPGTQISNVERNSPRALRYRDEALTALDDALLFLDGLEEDGVVTGERESDLRKVCSDLRITRLTISGNGFDVGGEA